jgi:voltage-gated potassium channel
MRTGFLLKVRRKTYELLERESPGDLQAKAIHRGLVALILINVIGSVLNTVPSINAVYDPYFDMIETVSLIIFALEYAARLWVAPESPIYDPERPLQARFGWMISGAGVIDLLAIAPFVVSWVFDIDLRVIVLFRLLRFFKIARYSPGFNSLIVAIRTERHALTACLVILISVILTSAGLMYVLEHDAQPDKFGSVPDAMWWAAATVTTVGYGDVVPITAAGRVVGVFTMITGLLMLALPAGIVASAFASSIARQHFVVTASMLTRMPLFSGLDASSMFEVLPVIATRSFDRRAQIVHRGARTGTLYILVEGEVEVEQSRKTFRIGAGEAFGGVLGPQRDLSVCALTRVRALVIEEHDVLQLCKRIPEFADRLAGLAHGERRRQQAQDLINKLTRL